MKRLLRKLYVRWLEEELAAYRIEVFAQAGLKQATKDTYYNQADKFVRWVKLQYIEPATDDEL